MAKSVKDMVDEALALITTHQVEQALPMLGRDDVVFVDLRDPRELERDGVVPGAVHAPRGMLEFWVDPASPYHKPVFNQPGKHYLVFCAGGLRSALAARTLVEMGLPSVSHLHGGFGAWKAAGAPVTEQPVRPPKPPKPAQSAG